MADRARNCESAYKDDPIGRSEIRVLILLPRKEYDDLWGYFEVVDLDERPVYRALSYTWGEPIFSHTLHLVGGDLSITSTVSAALRRIRDVEKPAQLWIDALCINQNDVMEKNQQVEMMAKV